MLMINATFFRRRLRSGRDFTEAADDAWRFQHPESDDEEAERDATFDPRRSSLERSMAKVDILDMLLLRRLFHALCQFDLLFSVNIWSDSSPNSGEELQGMVMDIMLVDGTHERIALPAASLVYGMFDSVSKTMAIVHAIWMIAGPDHATIAYVCSKVMSVTTDFGTEIHTLEMVDVTRAYCMWMAGKPMEQLHGFVNREQRWLPFAIRISGWSHTYGNMMKHVAESCPDWTPILKKLSAMVSFFHVGTWRTYIRKALRLNPPTDFDERELQTFTAKLATWRYEAVFEVLFQLQNLRALCQHHMRQEWFANAQDKALLREAFDAFGDGPLWTWIETALREVFAPTEGARHWGMVCICHKKERDEGKTRIECYWNSRRLPQAADFVRDETAARRLRSQNLPSSACEGNRVVHIQVKNMLGKLVSLHKQRLRYLQHPPWTAARCRSVQGAKEFMDQVQEHAMEEHDPYTRWFMHSLGAHVAARSQGEDLHVDLENELDRLATVPLDESAGEGYHRDVTYEKKRASGASIGHLKRSTRKKGVFRRLRVWKKTHGKRGRDVLRWEWAHWKRIARGNPRNKWTPVKPRRS